MLTLLAVVWFLPVRWVMPWIAPRLHDVRLLQLQGSIWDGHAGQVVATDGQVLGSLHWQLSHRALLGQYSGQLEFHGALGDFSGAVQRLPNNQLEWHDASARIDLSALPHESIPAFGTPRGQVQVTIPHAVLEAGWPLQLEAKVQWLQAAVRVPDGDVALGNLAAGVQSQGGVIHAQWNDDASGPLQTTGQLQLSPLGWRLEASMRPRQADPALQRWLAQWGKAEADGSVHVHSNGGLASGITSPHQDNTSR